MTDSVSINALRRIPDSLLKVNVKAALVATRQCFLQLLRIAGNIARHQIEEHSIDRYRMNPIDHCYELVGNRFHLLSCVNTFDCTTRCSSYGGVQVATYTMEGVNRVT